MKPFLLLALLIILAHTFNFRQVQTTPTVFTINSISNYTFFLDRSKDNNVVSTNASTLPISSSANFTVTFPDNYTSISNVTCLTVNVMAIAINNFTCNISGNTVTVSNAFVNLANLNVINVTLLVGNVLNPSPAIYTGTFSGTIGTDIAVPRTTGVQLTPGYFSTCSLTFSPNTVYNSISTMNVALVPTNNLTVSSSIQISFPRSYWTNDISTQLLPINSSMSCIGLTSNINSSITCVGSSNTLITVTNVFGSGGMAAAFSFGVKNFLSPPSNQPSDSITITSFISTYRVDRCTVFPSGLVPSNFTSFSITPTDTMTVNSLVGLRFNVTLTVTINQNDYFTIVFPNGTSFSYNQLYGTSYYKIPPTISGQTVLIYHSDSVISSFSQNTEYIITFFDYNAPPSTLPTDPIIFSVLRNGFPIMTSSASVTALSSTLSANVTAANKKVAVITSYTFSIATSSPLSSSGMIRITFPKEVTISTNSVNCATLTGLGVKSIPTCTYQPSLNSITISDLNSSSSTINAQTFQLTIFNITNPGDTSTSGNFSITTYYTSNTGGLTDTGSAPGVTSSIGTISINTVSVIPSSYIVYDIGVNYTISFNNTYTIPLAGLISITVPSDIGIAMSSLPTYCKLNINGSNFTSTACNGILNGTIYTINFTNVAATDTIPSNSRISLQISTICQNPTNTRIVSPFSITTFSSTSSIEALSGITVQMLTAANFSDLSVNRTSQQNSALSNYNISFRQQVQLPNATVLIVNFASQISMTINSKCMDKNGNDMNCSQISYQTFVVSLPKIIPNLQYIVIVTNVRNPPSYRPTATFFILQTKTPDQISSYTKGTLPTVFTNSQPSSFTDITYKYVPGAYGDNQSLILSITPSQYTTPTEYRVAMAKSFTINSLLCNSFVSFSGTCGLVIGSTDTISVKGMTGSGQIGFTISGFTSPTTDPKDYTSVSSFQSTFMIDQNTSFVIFNINCTMPCKTCTNVPTVCMSCYSISSVNTNNLYFSANKTCLSVCPSGYYPSTDLICQACSSTCLSCSIISTNCTSCNSTSSYPALNITNYTGSCLTSCPNSFYLNKNATPPQCTPCDSTNNHCSFCTDIDVCTKCVANYYLQSGKCVTTCLANVTIPNNSSWNCDPCSVQCATCTNFINNCSSCSANAAEYQGSCVTSCPYPYVINNKKCAGCDPICKTCSLIATNCTSCYINSTNPYLSVSSTFLGNCIPSCNNTYYGDILNGVCKLCSSLTINCDNCSSQTTCYSCNSGFILYLNTCISTPPLGYYSNGGVAAPCDPNCATCSNFATNCTSCVGLLNLDNNVCNSTCPSGKVGLSNLCVPCNSNVSFCKTCWTTQSYCTSCILTSPAVYLSLGYCVTNCPNYTYPDVANRSCQPCTATSRCEMCTTASACTTCVSGYFLQTTSCLLTCDPGFVGLNRICVACTNNCLTCSGSTSICLSCQPNYYLYNTTSPSCVAQCPTGLVKDNATMSCTGCSLTCATCGIYSNQCLSCPAGKYLQNQTCLSVCSKGYYPLGNNCTLCHSNCSACTSLLSCTSCAPNYYLYINSCQSTCPSSSPIINMNGSCSTCTNVYCISCNASNYCSGCYFPQVLVQGTCMSSCPTNYSLDTSGTKCEYAPNSSGTSIQNLTDTLTSSSVFPVPFTIASGFIGIACLMSKFQHERTFIPGALYALWGLLEWGAVCFFAIYYWLNDLPVLKLPYLLVVGGIGFLYLLNLIFLLVQNISLRNDKRLKSWLAGTFNSCCYYTLSILGLFTSNKIKNLLFSKLFAFPTFSAKLQNLHHLRSYYAFGFFAFISSLSVIAGICMLIAAETKSFDQMFMCKVDALVLSVLELIFAICHTRKQVDYFQDTDEDGIQVNRRVSSFDQVLNEYVQPQFGQQSQKSYLQRFESARKISFDSLSDIVSQKSLRDISVQAEQILGQRSLISRLGTQQISDFSMFKANDISIQMDQVKQVVDMSVGQEVIFLDASVNPQTINHMDASVHAGEINNRDASIDARVVSHHDASINAQTILLQDVSIEQTVLQKQQVSVQYHQPNKSISIQFDQPSHHEISIQYVPLYTDQTVHMTREEAEFAIQCNAQHQNISVQYSAKPLFEDMRSEVIPSETSLNFSEQQEPSDLELQKKLLEGDIARQQEGLKQELEIDIAQKLQRKQVQLQRLQAQRWQREKEQAMKNFQQKIEYKMQQVSQQHQPKQGSILDDIYNNSRSKDGPSSLMRTQQIIDIAIPPRFPPRPPSHKVSSDHSNYRDNFNQEQTINRQNHSQHHTARTQQEIINMLSGDRTSQIQDISKDSGFRRRANIQSGNYFMEEQPELLEEQPEQIPRHLAQNTAELFPSVDKSRSTANMTGRHGYQQEFILEDSQQIDTQKQRNQDESLIGHPIMPHRNRAYRHEEIDHNNKTNLNKFLQKKRNNQMNNSNPTGRNHLQEEEDALAREMQQRPLPPQRSERLFSDGKKRRSMEREFDNSDRLKSVEKEQAAQDTLTLQAKKMIAPLQFPKKLPRRQVFLQRRSVDSRRGYMKQTFTSQQKRKSLQKIYLQKMTKK